jgi:hypothetical protein
MPAAVHDKETIPNPVNLNTTPKTFDPTPLHIPEPTGETHGEVLDQTACLQKEDGLALSAEDDGTVGVPAEDGLLSRLLLSPELVVGLSVEEGKGEEESQVEDPATPNRVCEEEQVLYAPRTDVPAFELELHKEGGDSMSELSIPSPQTMPGSSTPGDKISTEAAIVRPHRDGEGMGTGDLLSGGGLFETPEIPVKHDEMEGGWFTQWLLGGGLFDSPDKRMVDGPADGVRSHGEQVLFAPWKDVLAFEPELRLELFLAGGLLVTPPLDEVVVRPRKMAIRVWKSVRKRRRKSLRCLEVDEMAHHPDWGKDPVRMSPVAPAVSVDLLSVHMSHPPTQQKTDKPHERGDLRHGDVPGGGRRIEGPRKAPDDELSRKRKEVLDQSSGAGRSGSWKGMEGHRSGHALASRTGIVPEAAGKSGNFFFSFLFGIRCILHCETVVWGYTHFGSWKLDFGFYGLVYGLVLAGARSVGGGYCHELPIRATACEIWG